MEMPRISSSRASLAISLVALFVALGGTALAVSKIGSSQIKNGAVTSTKLHAAAVTSAKIKAGAVTTAAIADNAVTSSKVADGSLTAGDVAPNTFLPATATAADSSKLGGLPPSSYVSGQGKLRSARLVLDMGSPDTEFLDLGFGHLSGLCDASGHAKIRFHADLSIDNVMAWPTNPGATDIQASNALGAGSFFDVAHGNALPQAITYQAAYNDGSTEHLATAWTTDQTVGSNQCVFTGQAITTL
jgi:hypothetical protein